MKRVLSTVIVILTICIAHINNCYASDQHITIDNYELHFTCYTHNNNNYARCYSITPIYYGQSTLNDVTVPEYVTESGYEYKVVYIGRCHTVRIKNITLPQTIEEIGDSCFCRSLFTTFDFPTNLKSIGHDAFRKNYNLKCIDLPSSVEKISYQAFFECDIDTAIINNCAIFEDNIFSSIPKTIIYTHAKSPQNWIATNTTYVPNLNEYSTPGVQTSTSHITEMITWKDSVFNYTGNTPTPLYVNNVVGYTPTMDFSSLHKDAGEWNDTVKVYYKDNKNGHDFQVKIPYHYTITPLILTATAQDVARLYGEENPSFLINYSGFVNNENESILLEKPVATTTANSKSDVGIYPITVSGGRATNYNLVYKNGVLTINKAPLFARVNNTSRPYGEENPTFSLVYEGLKNNETSPKWTDSPQFSTDATKQSDVGEYAINATAKPTNYSLTAITPGTLNVTPASLVLKANDATRKYFEDDPIFDFTCTGFVNNDDRNVITTQPIYSTQAIKASDTGTYLITPDNAYAKNYQITYETGTLTITKRDLKVIADNKARLYGDENPPFTLTYEGFVNNDNVTNLTEEPSVSCIATQQSNVGNYDIVLSGGSAKNYTFSSTKGTLTVTKAPLTAIVNNCEKVYGQENPTFSCSYDGLKNGETEPKWTKVPTYSTEATKMSGVGKYEIMLTDGFAKNYDVTFVNGILNITKAMLTIKTDNKSRLYYEENPEFTYSCSGMVNSDDVSMLTKMPVLDCEASLTSKVGTYTIKASGAEAKNYEISYDEGLLTIEKRTLTVTPDDATRKYAEQNPAFGYTITGLVYSEDGSILLQSPTIYTDASEFSDVGRYAIFAKDAIADNYTFDYKQGTLTIEKANQTITWEQDFNDIKVGDQIELQASSTSGLDIEYVFDTAIVSLYTVGSQQYLDCLASGTFPIRATQNGNKNYNPAVRVAKTITIGDPSGISAIIAESFSLPIYFDLSGKRINSLPQKGVVVRIINGKTEKILIR